MTSLNFKELTQVELAKIAIENHLYIDDWQIYLHYTEIAMNRKLVPQRHIVVLFEGDKPIGACTISFGDYQIAVFVSDEARGKGAGSLLIEQALKKTGYKRSQVYAGNGIEGSESFFEKNKIVVLGSGLPLTNEQTKEFLEHKKTYKQLLKECIDFEYIKKFGSLDCELDKDVLMFVETTQ